MAALGDIVSVSGRPGRWVVMGLVGSPDGWPLHARVIRRSGDGATAFSTSSASLTLLESPAFTPGERVTVNGRPGAVQADNGESVAVRLDASTHELSDGYRLALPAADCAAPRWQLVLENRL